MSRSAQVNDASMDEILASIRRIITEDDPESDEADMLARLDGLREAVPDLASAQPSAFMSDLTRALSQSDPPGAADDDILDAEDPDTGFADRMREALATGAASAIAPPQPVADGDLALDDVDLFEPEMPQASDPADLVLAEDDDEVIEDLGDPIALGPEIELVDDFVLTEASEADGEAPTAEAARDAERPIEEASGPIAELAVETAPAMSVEPAAEEPAAGEPVDNATETVVAGAPEEPMAQVVEAAISSEPAPATMAEADVALGPPVPAEPKPEPATAIEQRVEDAGEAASPPLEEAHTEPEAEVAEAAVVEAAVVEIAPAAATASAPASEPSAVTMVASAPLMPEAALASEEMMAALLKPMLKEWLDANMPRIVAKAMATTDEGEQQAS